MWYKQTPPYLLGLLVLSKRLHSIFVLRLFNDCFAILGIFVAIYLFQIRMHSLGSLVFSLAISIKMTVLLATPGLAMFLLQALPARRIITLGLLMLQVQVLLASPFISTNVSSYLGRAFDLTRQFRFEWTVNWKFLSEEFFSSHEFAEGLLIAHAALLSLFCYTRWNSLTGLAPWALVRRALMAGRYRHVTAAEERISPDFVMQATLTSLLIGVLCARSLHFQFFVYIAWSTPYLMWRAGLPSYLIIGIWAAQELAWNIFPSTSVSSLVVVAALAIQIVGIFMGTRNDHAGHLPPEHLDGRLARQNE